MRQAVYDQIGSGYDAVRRADPYLTGRLMHLLNLSPGDTCLDIGCGTGNYTSALAGAGVSIVGLDFSARMISQAKEKHPTLPWVQGDATTLPFADGSFSGAISTLAVHHFPAFPPACHEVYRTLKHGRWVIFTALPEQMMNCWLLEYFPRAVEGSIQQMMDLGRIADGLEKAGFSRISTEPYDIRDDLQDRFLYAGKHRPEIYLDPEIRAGISTFTLMADPEEVEQGCRRLADDIESGVIQDVIRTYEHEGGDYMFVIAEKC